MNTIRSDPPARADGLHYFIDGVASKASKQLPRIKDVKTHHKTIDVEKNQNDSVSILSPAAIVEDTRAAGDLSCTPPCGASATGPDDRFSPAEFSFCMGLWRRASAKKSLRERRNSAVLILVLLFIGLVV